MRGMRQNQWKEKNKEETERMKEDIENKFQELINKIDTNRLLYCPLENKI